MSTVQITFLGSRARIRALQNISGEFNMNIRNIATGTAQYLPYDYTWWGVTAGFEAESDSNFGGGPGTYFVVRNGSRVSANFTWNGNPPDAPGLTLVPSNQQITVNYTAAGSFGVSLIRNEYSLNNSTWTTLPATSGSFTLTGLTNAIPVQVWLRGVNSLGTGAVSTQTATPSLPPDPPTNVTATPGASLLSINYTAPVNNGGSAITRYEYSLNQTTWTSAGLTRPFNITGLTNGISYTYFVRAVNPSGASTSVSITGTPATVPAAPTALVPTPSNQTISLAYTAVPNTPAGTGGSAILRYEYSLNGTTWTDVQFSKPVIITGLTNGTSYTVRLRAVSAIGNGTTATAAATTVATTPATPTNVVATTQASALQISYTAVPATLAGNGGSVVTRYEYSLDEVTWTSSGLTNPFTISGLTNGTSYTYLFRAVNAVGPGGATTVTGTPGAVPAAPTGLVATRGDGALTIDYAPIPNTPAATGGYSILRYEYSLDNVNWVNIEFTDPFIISGLVNGTSYTVRLRGVSSFGNGTVATVTQTPAIAPAAPTNLVLTPSGSAIQVGYTAVPTASNGGAAITRYEYSLNETTWTTMALTNPFTITGLTNATTYNVSIRAVNVIGPSPSISGTATPAAVPVAPTGLVATVQNTALSIDYVPIPSTPAATGGYPVLRYEYSLDNVNWVDIGFMDPFVISSLANGTSYTVRLRGVSTFGNGITATVTATPATNPIAPTNVVATPLASALSISYTAVPAVPASNGGAAIIRYEYSLNEVSWTSAALTNPFTISSLINGTSYTYYVRAVNSVGPSPSVTVTGSPGSVPAAPTGLVAAIQNTALSVSYTAIPNTLVATGGYPILRYEYSLNNVNWTDMQFTNPVVISGLTNGTSYTVRLRGVSSFGNGTAASVTQTPATTPFPPTNLALTPLNASLRVAYTASANNGGSAISRYEYSFNQSTWTTMAMTNPFTITGLTNGTSYTVYIRAVNGVGASTSINATESPVTTPNAPTGLGITVLDTALRISFTAASSNGGRPILRYEYSFNNVTWIDAGLTSPFTITGLTNGTSYTVYLRTVTSFGVSTAPTVTAIPGRIPDAPTNLVLTPLNTSLRIAYTTPTNNGGYAISRYEYSFNQTSWTTMAFTNPFTVSSLTNGTAYTVYVRAVNAIGASLAINDTTTPRTTPGVPTNLIAMPLFSSLSINYTAPTSDGGNAITRYEYSLDNTNWVSVGLTKPFIIGGLLAPGARTVYLRAVNDAGPSVSSAGIVATPYTTTPFLPNAGVVVNFEVEVDANSFVNMFGMPGPSTFANVLVAEKMLPVNALYDAVNKKGLIEIWEPANEPGNICAALANTNNGTGETNFTGAYKDTLKQLAKGLQRILCNKFDCVGVAAAAAAPFNSPQYSGRTAYTTQRDFGRVALGAFAHYLFGHVDATAAITNDVGFIKSMLSLSGPTADAAATNEYDALGPAARYAAYSTAHVNEINNVDITLWTNKTGSGADANLAKRLTAAIVGKGLNAQGQLETSKVSDSTLTEEQRKAKLAYIVAQIVGQDGTRLMNEDNSERGKNMRALLRFYEGDIIYVNIKLATPNVSVGAGQAGGVNKTALESSYTAQSYMLKITLGPAEVL
jgi:hypothetical protein